MSHGGNAKRNGTITAIIYIALALGVVYNIFAIQSGRSEQGTDIYIHGQKFDLQIAETKRERENGLAGVKKLAPTEGMAFLFPSEGKYEIWMKGMKIPIDIVWVAKDTVVQITPNVQPQPDVPDAELVRYGPDQPVTAIIELPAGAAESQRIQKGDLVEIFPNSTK